MKCIESKSPFLSGNDEFNNVINNLLLEKQWTSLKFGIVSTSKSDRKFYLLFVDNKAHLINDEFDISTIPLKDILTNFEFAGGYLLFILNSDAYLNHIDHIRSSDFLLNKREKNQIDSYKKNLVKYESNYLKWIKSKSNILLRDNNVKMLLSNFLDRYLKDFFKVVTSAYYLEDDLLAPIFCRSKKLSRQIVLERRKSIEEKYQKIIDLFFKREYLIPEKMLEIESSGFLIINKALLDIAPSYYSESFNKSYGGFFPAIEKMNFDDCIHSYFKIDHLVQTDDININLLTYYLYSRTTFLEKYSNHSLLRAFELVKEKVMNYKENKELMLFEQELIGANNHLINSELNNITIDEIDMMSGFEFEDFISYLFAQMGYKVNSTPKSGDQGIDVIVIKNGLRIGIQTKRYTSSVSNTAIQEVVAGVKHYDLHKAIVITNNYFTESAVELGISNDVILWDRNILKEKIKNIKSN